MFCDGIQSTGARQMSFVSTVRSYEVSEKKGRELYDAIVEDFAPEDLFHDDIRMLPILLRKFRDHLLANEVEVPQHSSRRIARSIASVLFTGEDLEAAENLIRGKTANSPAASTPIAFNASNRASSLNNDENKIAHQVAMRFKDDSTKFDWSIGQCFKEFLTEYTYACKDYGLAARQRMNYFHHMFKGEAKRFYMRHVEGQAKTMAEAVELIENEFNSPTRQNRVKNYLQSLTITALVNAGKTRSDALANLYSYITRMEPMLPESHRGEAHKIEFLKNAVIGESWAREPISAIAPDELSFQEFNGRLEASLQQEVDEQKARAADGNGLTRTHGDKPVIPVHHGHSQPRYGRDNSHARSANKSTGTRKTPSCFNCSGPHYLTECIEPLDEGKVQIARERYRNGKITKDERKRILFQICDVLEVEGHDSNADDEKHESLPADVLYGSWGDLDDTEIEIDLTSDRSSSNDYIALFCSNVSQEDPVILRNTCCGANCHSVSANSQPNFFGACLDTGAQRSVVGQIQARAYCAKTGTPVRLTRSELSFKFGSHRHRSLEKLQVTFPMPGGSSISHVLDVVTADIPMLFGLEILDHEKLFIDNTANELVSKSKGWRAPIVRKQGDLFLEYNPSGNYEVLYTKHQLQRLHKHFFHPGAIKLYNLLKRSRPENANEETLTTLREISRACATCQRFSPRPISFQVTVPGHVVFNEEVALDLMWIDSHPALHIVDTQTHFSSAMFLRGESTEDVWTAFVEGWTTLYVGYPTKMRTDRGSVFTSKLWAQLTHLTNIQLQLSGVESHNSLGSGEHYHAPLRRIYLKVKAEFPGVQKEVILRYAVKAMNDTVGPEGLIPSLLVFGVMPQLPGTDNPKLPAQSARMRALTVARREMETIVADMRLSHAMRAQIPRAANTVINVGMRVLVYREKKKKWVGPFSVIMVSGKDITIEDHKGKERHFNITNVKPHVEDDPVLRPILASWNEDPWDGTTAVIDNSHHGNMESTVLITEVLPIGDKRASKPEFIAASEEEMTDLLSRGTFKAVPMSSLPAGANVIGGRFVLTIKNKDAPDMRIKARYVAQGHRDDEKNFLVHKITTLRQTSTRIIISLAALYLFKIWSHDVSQAYLQSSEKLDRDVYLKPSPRDRMLAPLQQFMKEGDVLKVERPLYGLADACDLWHQTIDAHLTKDLGLEKCMLDKSLYFLRRNSKLVGMVGQYVDDSLLSGDPGFQKDTEKTLEKFDCRERCYDDMRFAGVFIQHNGEVTSLNQAEYASKLELLLPGCTFTEYRRLRAKLAWMMHTRPDICFDTCVAAQVTEKMFRADHVEKVNKVVRHLRKHPMNLSYSSLDPESLVLKVYSDSSFANNEDLTSQLGFIILLSDAKNRCNILHYTSYKARRVTRSVLGAETYAFADAFDMAFTLRTDLQSVIGKRLPLIMCTDSKSLFDIITKDSISTERRLMIDISAVLAAYEKGEIDHIQLVSTKDNPADCFTKEGRCTALESIVHTGTDGCEPVQWVSRSMSSQE